MRRLRHIFGRFGARLLVEVEDWRGSSDGALAGFPRRLGELRAQPFWETGWASKL